MNIGLTIQQALKLTEGHVFEEGSQLFTIYDGLDHGPVVYRNNQLWVGEDILLADLDQCGDFILYINAIDNELKDLYAMQEYGMAYDSLSSDAKSHIGRVFKSKTGLDIDDPMAADIVSVFGFDKPIPELTELKDGAISTIINEHYSGKDVIRHVLVGGQYVFVFCSDGTEFKVYHHRLSDLSAMNSRIVDSLERQIESLTKRMELHKSYEKRLEKDKNIEVEKSI